LAAFLDVGRNEGHGPGIIFRVPEAAGTSGDEQLWHLLLIEILLGRRIRRGSNRAVHHQNALVFDQPPCRLDGFWRTVAIVKHGQFHLSAVDTASAVDGLKVGERCLPHHAGDRDRTAERHRLAKSDLGV